MFRSVKWMFALALVAACRSQAPEAAPSASSSGPATAPAAPAPSTDGVHGNDPTMDGGEATPAASVVKKAQPTSCSPHIDATDPEHKFSPVEAVYRRVKVAKGEAVELLVLDVPGACDFETRRPADYRGLKVRLERPDKLEAHHFVLGATDEKDAGATFAFVAPGKGGSVVTSPAQGGIVDLMDVRGDVLAIGFNVKTAAGDSFGCFEAQPCR